MKELDATIQEKILSGLLAGLGVQATADAAGCDRSTVWRLKQDATFMAEFNRRKGDLLDAALSQISLSTSAAAQKLVALLDCKDDRIRRLACNDLLGYAIQGRELEEMELRLTAVEAALKK